MMSERDNPAPQTPALPRIDYSAHPAYQGLRSREAGEDKVSSLIGRIDEAWLRLGASLPASEPELVADFNSSIGGLLAELKRETLSGATYRADFKRYLDKVFESAHLHLLRRLASHYHIRRPEPRAADGAPGSGSNIERMRRDGFLDLGVKPDLARAVWQDAWLERWLVKRKARKRPSGRAAMALHSSSPMFNAVDEALARLGVYQVSGQYLNCETELLYVALEYSHDGQTWYKGCYEDRGLPASDTTYMHFDADYDVLKLLFYLRDVGPLEGPFSYVTGSNQWRRSPALLALYRGFDAEQPAMVEVEPDGSDYKLGYYRPRFKLPEYREEMMKLPASLRGSTHFGDDVVNGSNYSRTLLAGEHVFLGKAGTLVLFDGSAGVHRGGMVQKGERWALQIGLQATRGVTRERSVGLQHRMRYYRHLTKQALTGDLR